MPNRMIYISEAVIGQFDTEPNKSGLVNQLLGHHYGQTHIEAPTTGHTYVQPKLVPKFNFPDTKAANGVCKIHGLPLDARGRCLQKGCKYA